MNLVVPKLQQSEGVSRNITHIYKNFRQRSAPIGSFSNQSGREILLRGIPQSQALHSQQLPPVWIDSYQKVQQDLQSVQHKSKSYSVQRLKKVQRERSQITFGNTQAKDEQIKVLSSQITQQNLYSLIKATESFISEVAKESESKVDKRIRENIQRQLAKKLQDLTQQHRLTQREYMDRLRGTQEDSVHFFDQQEKESGFLELDDIGMNALQRNQDIDSLVNNLRELAEIFKELSALVVDQGTIVDRIDYNIEQAKDSTQKAVKELVKADQHQRSARASTCLLLLIVAIVVMVLALIYKDS